MSDTSRRKFLAATGAGVAGGVVATGAAAQAATPTRDSAREEVVAYVPDHRLAEVRLMVGEREIVVQDKALATAILNAAGGR
jgi:hypothetical protein